MTLVASVELSKKFNTRLTNYKLVECAKENFKVYFDRTHDWFKVPSGFYSDLKSQRRKIFLESEMIKYLLNRFLFVSIIYTSFSDVNVEDMERIHTPHDDDGV